MILHSNLVPGDSCTCNNVVPALLASLRCHALWRLTEEGEPVTTLYQSMLASLFYHAYREMHSKV